VSEWEIVASDANQVPDKAQQADAKQRLKDWSRAQDLTTLRGQSADGRIAYYVDEPLRNAINQALLLGMPLLLTGEPGTGKTTAGYWLAQYLGITQDRVHHHTVRSTSTAEELKFNYDAVRWLRAAQAGDKAETIIDNDGDERPLTQADCLYKGPLWQSYEAGEGNNASLVIIDEIDKAPRDFPNDLLEELDRHSFTHPFEPSRRIPEKPLQTPPVVIVTSNRERSLPAAFMRRCIWHEIELTDLLIDEAVRAQLSALELQNGVDPELLKAARTRFDVLRSASLLQRPSLAELLNWLLMLHASNTNAADITNTDLIDTPHRSLLIKHAEDLDTLRRQAGR